MGTATVIVRPTGTPDHLGRPVAVRRADVVGVYVKPTCRGDGTIDRLLEAAVDWARGTRATVLALDVHVDNIRAQRAYRRAGFHPAGTTARGPAGDEIQMVRALP